MPKSTSVVHLSCQRAYCPQLSTLEEAALKQAGVCICQILPSQRYVPSAQDCYIASSLACIAEGLEHMRSAKGTWFDTCLLNFHEQFRQLCAPVDWVDTLRQAEGRGRCSRRGPWAAAGTPRWLRLGSWTSGRSLLPLRRACPGR
eukprot:1157886-Pelagomonas_calceolata.AAC.4